MIRKFLLFIIGLTPWIVRAQEAILYQQPPAAITQLVLAQPTPSVLFTEDGRKMVVLERSAMPTVEELAQPELRIAGLRINPRIFAPSRSTYYSNFSIRIPGSGKLLSLKGVPQPLKASNFEFNPSETQLAFTQSTANGIDLYTVDLNSGLVRKINKTSLNLVLGDAFSWWDDQTLLYKGILKPASQAPQKPIAPKGPTIQQNLGKVAASVTYQDLIKSPFDEELFAFYGTAQLMLNNKGMETPLGLPGIFQSVDPSPDLHYLLIERIDRPFSYLVPAGGFNSTVFIADLKGKPVKELARIPSSELAPTGYDNTLNAPRNFEWISTQAATVSWIEPLDSGLIKKKLEYHDALVTLDAPFTGSPSTQFKTTRRLSAVSPINKDLWIVYERSRAKHMAWMSLYSKSAGTLSVLNERSTDDAYNDPGSPVMVSNAFHRKQVQLLDGNTIWMRGNGASPDGDMPFLNAFHLDTKQTEPLWRCAAPYFESVIQIVDYKNKQVITNRQSQQECPNYYLLDLVKGTRTSLTQFADPQPVLRTLSKQKINYKRKDGVDLTAELYLPPGYNPEKDGRLPVFMWAYPREFKSAADAAQVRGSKYTFTRLSWGSAVYWATQGYAVMDNTEFPIVGEGDQQPNDLFIEQLVMNAEAAIQKIHDMGIGDTSRVAVGGHSYGAFMTSNLLAHTQLFRAGISRSGAYNRTLTPFGFQNEERTYWQAPDVYFKMSPFSYANQIKTPLLLIHGEADNNPGTFPIQSERLYNAVKGHGGIVRYVQLPFESHGYTAKENVLHMFWEMNEWLNKYVKHAPKR